MDVIRAGSPDESAEEQGLSGTARVRSPRRLHECYPAPKSLANVYGAFREGIEGERRLDDLEGLASGRVESRCLYWAKPPWWAKLEGVRYRVGAGAIGE